MYTVHARKKETRKALMRIRRNVRAADRKGKDWPKDGICWLLGIELARLVSTLDGFEVEDRTWCTHLVHSLFPSWPLYSGDATYPVPVGTAYWRDSQLIFEEASEDGARMWSGKKPGWIAYAKARRNLLDFLIDELDK